MFFSKNFMFYGYHCKMPKYMLYVRVVPAENPNFICLIQCDEGIQN